MKFKFTFCLMLLFSIGMTAQTNQSERNRLMQKADRAFYIGDYGQARNFYARVYAEFNDTIAKFQITKCDKCQRKLNDAMTDEISGQYFQAKKKYEHILFLNPLDPNIKKKIDNCMRVLKKIGDDIDGYKVCYVDSSGMHGYLLYNPQIEATYSQWNLFKPNNSWRVPSFEEMFLIQPSRHKLGLNALYYWTNFHDYTIRDGFKHHYFFIYDFYSSNNKEIRGRKIKTMSESRSDLKYNIFYIKDF